MGVLSGFVVPDSGSVEGLGSAWPLGQPFAIKERGVAMVHQHFTLVPEFTVAENLALARLGSLHGVLDVGSLAAPALAFASQLGWSIEGGAKARSLPVGAQQRVEILKALSADPKVLILDEPTAVLSPDEVQDLFRVLRSLRDAGKAVVLIAHKLSEVMAIADRVTVLRRGQLVAESPLAETNAQQLAEWMVGDVPEATGVLGAGSVRPGLKVAGLKVMGQRGQVALHDVSFEIGRGEILGFGGVDGNGQVELAEVLAGVRAPAAGSVSFEGGADEVAYIPQDRRDDGLALSMTIAENLLIVGHRRVELTRGPFLIPGKVREWVKRLVERFQIKVGSVNDPVRSLSGGNQQKVVVSRAMDRIPSLLVAVNPTRGLDLKATDYVHRQILLARDSGAAVALISTDLDELAALSTRTRFLSNGGLVEGAVAGLSGGVG
jgi:general nucleoside transport system ATP-binding protein